MFKFARVLLIMSLLAGLLALPAVVSAQGGTPINYGDTVFGEITNETSSVFYTFNGNAGDQIIISMNGVSEEPRLDTYLSLLGPNGVEVASDDDGGGNLNSLLGPYQLPEAGQYTIVATRFLQESGTSTGTYDLTLALATINPLSLNENISVDLNDGSPQVFFSYTSAGNELFTLQAESIEGDSAFVITVTTESGEYLNQAYGFSDEPALLDPVSFAEPGNYRIGLRREPSPNVTSPTGQPSVAGTAVRVAMSVVPVESQALTLGTAVSGTLDAANASDHYTFTGSAGDLLSLVIARSAGDMNLDVQVTGPQGYPFNGVSLFTDQTETSIDPLILNESGQYLVVVRPMSFGGGAPTGTSAAYTLTVSPAETPALVFGTPVQGTIDQASGQYEQYYAFTGTEGQTVRFTLESLNEDYAPGIDVQGPNLDFAAMPADAGPVDNFFINLNSSYPGTVTYEVTLPFTGNYLFRVYNGSFSGSGLGEAGDTPDYSLLLEEVTE